MTTDATAYQKAIVAEVMALVDAYADTAAVNGIRSQWAQMARGSVEVALTQRVASASAHPAEGVPAQQEFPNGAIVNGRTHIERLEAHYQFECDAGSLVMCDDWNELKRYFEHLANWASAATQPAAQGLKPIAQAIRDYHYDLDTRKNWSVAADTALNAIQDTLGMYWHQGQEAEARAAQAKQGGAA